MDKGYIAPGVFRWSHAATVLPNQLRPAPQLPYQRRIITTPDQDRFALDMVQTGSPQLTLLLHGLEGSSASTYIRGMAQVALLAGHDIMAINHRSCGGLENLTPRSYHSGFTADLSHVLSLYPDYQHVNLVGFSLGGNIALKYAGEGQVDPRIRCVSAISVPIDLAGSSRQLELPGNVIYRLRFLGKLKRKALQKAARFPGSIDEERVKQARTIARFDDAYTAPLHGFKHAEDYYKRNSAIRFLASIEVPTLLINAQDDSFLSPSCFPYDLAKKLDHLTLLTPRHGGHVGFATDIRMKKTFWHETQVMQFIQTFEP